MIRAAKAAVSALRDYLNRKDDERRGEEEAARKRKSSEEERLKNLRSQMDLVKLKDKLEGLCIQLGTQEGGYAFEKWFYELMDYFEVDYRRPYKVAGRQIDGSVTIDGTTYLAELKFTATQSDAPDVDSLLKKVNDKADNTMGLMISMSGFSSVAIREASFARSPLLLLDFNHLYMVLGGLTPFAEVVRRVRRHSSQEGKAYLSVSEFGGR